MKKEEFLKLIEKGEGLHVEFKKAEFDLPKSIWETYSAFANTDGGVIILGVSENKKNKFITTGVANAGKIIKEFWNQVNNTQKVNSNIVFNKEVRVIKYENKEFVLIRVPRANRQEKPVFLNNNVLTGSYRRNADGDYKCSNEEVKAMLRDQSDISADTLTFEEIALKEIITDTLRRYRIRFQNLKPNHIWNNLRDEEFLLKIGGAKRINNKLQPTLAGMVMFGSESIITSVLPNYFLDYREKNSEEDIRWVDRIYSSSGSWSGNLFDFYFMVTEKILSNTKVAFQLNDITRIDETPFHEAIREAIANTLIHADYNGTRGIVIEKVSNKLKLQNPGTFRISITAASEGGISDPRNASVFKCFSLVGIGERAGSGLHSIYYVWNNFGFVRPVLKEFFNPERISFVVDWDKMAKSSEKDNKSSEKITISSEKTSVKILKLIVLNREKIKREVL